MISESSAGQTAPISPRSSSTESCCGKPRGVRPSRAPAESYCCLAFYITKPFDPDELVHLVSRALEHRATKGEVVRLKENLQEVFPQTGPVTGKEIVARAMLRERREDIPLLVAHFLTKYATQMNRPSPRISAAALDVILEYHWPGNVRELENAVERAMLISRDNEIQPSDFPFQLRPAAVPEGGRTLEEVEKAHIQKILIETNRNLSRTARILDIDRTTLYNKLKRYGLKT